MSCGSETSLVNAADIVRETAGFQYMGFQLLLKLVTLNYLEQRKSRS